MVIAPVIEARDGRRARLPVARVDDGNVLTPVVATPMVRPRVAPEVVPRPRLVRMLSEADARPLSVLVAPAGYGKTTLLAEWSEHDDRPFAWVTFDERDNDPRRLLTGVRRAIAVAVGRDGGHTPFVLVLDDVHALHERMALAAVAAVANDLPPQAALAVASRTQPQLPVARMRAERSITELGPRELAMTRAETAAMLKAEHHDLGRDGVELLLGRTEGWPAALSLAAVFLDERGAAALAGFNGADRLVAQYVRDEVLSAVPAEQLEFMLRTCVADTLTAPLCDTLAGRPGSAPMLAELARTGLVVPLDRSDERFRYHRLVAETLHAELHASAPECEPELHRLASRWHRRAGDVDRAIDHALRAGDVAAAGRLVWDNLAPLVAAGTTSTAEHWLGRFTQGEIAEHATLALTAAGCALLRGQGETAAHWTAAAAAARSSAPALQLGVAILRSALAGAPAESMSDVDAAQPGDAAARSLCSLVDGTARQLEGDREGAAKALENGARGAAVCAPLLHALCLAQLAVLALDQDDWEAAAAPVTRARAQVDRYSLADHAPMALVFAVSALVRARRGRMDVAQSDLSKAVRLQSEFVDIAPGIEAEVSLLVARAALRLSDVNLAREQRAAASRLLRRLPDAILLHRWAADLTAQIDAFAPAGQAAHEVITAAELRTLQYLPTHLSFREIGELTYVSGNTVKTQANAIYRKLGVSSRSEAVEQARGCGLLDGA